MIALYGGSFDPPHKGHKNLIDEFFRFYPEVKHFFLVPNFLSPFKKDKYLSIQETLEVLDEFKKDLDHDIKIADYEIKQSTLSYTYNTILYFKKEFKDEEIFFLLGEDLLVHFSKWYKYKEILKLCKLIIFKRYYHKEIVLPKELESNSIILNNQILEISSTEIKSNLESRNKNLTKNVYEYLEKIKK
jgi:nicotinate-nucleotide adenylyltransferase